MNAWTNKRPESYGADRKSSWLELLARTLKNWRAKLFSGEVGPEHSRSSEAVFPPTPLPEQGGADIPADLPEPMVPTQDWFAEDGKSALDLRFFLEEDGISFQAAEADGASTEGFCDEGNSMTRVRKPGMTPAIQPQAVELSVPRVDQGRRRDGTSVLRTQGTKPPLSRFLQRKLEATSQSIHSRGAEALPDVEIAPGNDSLNSSAQFTRAGSSAFPAVKSHDDAQDHQPRVWKDRIHRMPVQLEDEDSSTVAQKPSEAAALLRLFESRRGQTEEGKAPQPELRFTAAPNDPEQTRDSDIACARRLNKPQILPVTGRQTNRPSERPDSARSKRFDARKSHLGVGPAGIASKAQSRRSSDVMWPALRPNGKRQSSLGESPSFKKEWPVGDQHCHLDYLPEADAGRWPDLPEDESTGDPGWMQVLRAHEHLKVLDAEQRGGD